MVLHCISVHTLNHYSKFLCTNIRCRSLTCNSFHIHTLTYYSLYSFYLSQDTTLQRAKLKLNGKNFLRIHFWVFFSNFLEILVNFLTIYKLPNLLLKFLNFFKFSKPVNTINKYCFKNVPTKKFSL